MEANEEGEDVAKTAGHPLDEQEAAKEPVRDCPVSGSCGVRMLVDGGRGGHDG